jgi:hypothetical protein
VALHHGWEEKTYRPPIRGKVGNVTETKSAVVKALAESKSISPGQSTSNGVKIYEPVPAKSQKLAYFDKGIASKLFEPVIRAFHSRGWSITKDWKRAHVLWYDQPEELEDLFPYLKPWQRFNQLYNTEKWDDKDSMAYYMNAYYYNNDKPPLHSFPETYVLNHRDDLIAFQKRLLEKGGIYLPWVVKQPTLNRGEGVNIVAPQSKDLYAVANMTIPDKETFGSRLIAQQYICNELTYSGRKFDFRVFWMVASVDPLIVLYHTGHNYVRIGHAKYDESNFASTKSHLTTHTFGAEEKKATWDEFKVFIEEFQAIQGERLAHLGDDPFRHVQNQVMQALAHLVDAYRNITFHKRDLFAMQNAFTLHAADMIIDNDLDVYLIEGTDGPGKDEDYDFRISMHDSIFGSMVDILEAVTDVQAKGLPVNIKDMEEKGVLGDYQVIVDNDWIYEYRDYEQLRVKNKKGCNVNKGAASDVNTNVSLAKVAARAKTTALPRNLTAMGFDSDVIPSKLCYMEGRTGSAGEMVARGFRRNGWNFVDDVEMAQIVYDKKQPEQEPSNSEDNMILYDRELKPWQFYNHFPMTMEQHLFGFQNLKKYTDAKNANAPVCSPIAYRRRRFHVVTYMLVVSWNPLIVYYHDGYLDIPFSENDENEFLVQGDGSLVWRGSWKTMEAMVKVIAQRKDVEDPVEHVRSQFKRSLVKAGEGLALDIQDGLERLDANMKALPHYYGLYKATFEVDRILNTFLVNIDNWMLTYGESYKEIVELNNDLFGAAFKLLETVNATMNTSKKFGGVITVEEISKATEEVKGGYQLILYTPNVGKKDNSWKFEYDWDEKAKECMATRNKKKKNSILKLPTKE